MLTKEEIVIESEIAVFLQGLFSTLNEKGVLYCVLRNYESLPYDIGNDLDLFVSNNQIKDFESILFDGAKKHGWLLLKRPKRFGYQSYWYYHPISNSFIHIDAFSQTSWKGLLLSNAESLLTLRKRCRDFYVPVAADEYYILFMKDLMQDGKIKEKYLDGIHNVVVEDSDAFLDRLIWSVGQPMADELIDHIFASRWKKIESMKKRIRLATIATNLRNRFMKTCASIILFLTGHLQALLIKPNGIFIALIGPDGSGKTTVSEGLRSSLIEIFPAMSFDHGRFGITPNLRTILNLVRRFVGKRPLAPEPSGVHAVHDRTPHGKFRAIIYFTYYMIDFILGHWVIRSAKARGKMILFDRYYYDYFIMGGFKNLPKVFFKAASAILPKPDLVFFLRNDPEDIHRRKAELTVEKIQQQNKACERIVINLPYAQTVSTGVPIDETVSFMKEKIVEKLANRWSGK